MKLPSVLAGALGMTLLWTASPTRAEERSSVPAAEAPSAPPEPQADEIDWLAPASRPPNKVDPVRTGAFISLLTGGALAVAGAVAWGVSEGMSERVCGQIAGCFERPDGSADELRGVGTALTGAGLGMALASAAYFAFEHAFPRAEDVEMRNERAATAGMLLISLSAGLLGGGIFYSELSDPRGAVYNEGWPFLLAAAASGIAAVPLFAVGIRVQDDYDKARRRLDKIKRRPKKSELELDLAVTPAGVALRGSF